MKTKVTALWGKGRPRAALFVVQAIVLAASAIVPALSPGKVSAAQLQDRKATISTSKPSSTDVEFIFNYDIPTTGPVQGITYEFCTTPLAACTASGWTLTGFTHDSQTFDQGTAFAAHAASDENDCTQSTNATKMICFERTAGGAEVGPSVHTISGINFNATIQTVYIRISLYSDNDFQTADLTDTGVVAVAVNRQLTTTGRVQERLSFCVFSIDDAAALPTDCTAAPTTTTIDIGVVDNSAVAVAPVNNTPPTSLGNDMYGALLVNTNAQDGIGITYFPESAATGTEELRSFRVSGATCINGGASLTDQCFVSADAAAEVFSAGTERFGMVIPCIDNTQGTTTNLGSVVDAYNGDDDSIAVAGDCENEGETEFAWEDAGTPTTLASSTNVVDDEIIKLRFAATASPTTPTGSYSVVTTYIATPQF